MFFNVVFLILLFLIYAVQFASIYKFFRYKSYLKSVSLFLFTILVLVLTVSYFFTRHALIYNEIQWIIAGIKNCNLYAISVVVLNILLLISSLYCYLIVVKTEKKNQLSVKEK